MAGGNAVGITNILTTYGRTLQNRQLDQTSVGTDNIYIGSYPNYQEFYIQNANTDGSNAYDSTAWSITLTTPRMLSYFLMDQ